MKFVTLVLTYPVLLVMKNCLLKEYIQAGLSELYVITILVLLHDELVEYLKTKVSYKTFTKLRKLKYLLLGKLDTMPPYILEVSGD